MVQIIKIVVCAGGIAHRLGYDSAEIPSTGCYTYLRGELLRCIAWCKAAYFYLTFVAAECCRQVRAGVISYTLLSAHPVTILGSVPVAPT